MQKAVYFEDHKMICKCKCHKSGVSQNKACPDCLHLHIKNQPTHNQLLQSAFFMGVMLGAIASFIGTYFFMTFT